MPQLRFLASTAPTPLRRPVSFDPAREADPGRWRVGLRAGKGLTGRLGWEIWAKESGQRNKSDGGLAEGQSLLVTAKGRPEFIVTKGTRPRMTRALAESRAVGDPEAPTFDGTAFLSSLKK